MGRLNHSHGHVERSRSIALVVGHRRGLLVLAALAATTLALVALAPGAEAATTVPGGLRTTSDTWTLEGSPYHVTGTLIFRQGAVLTVEPGVVVEVDPGVRLKFGDSYCCPNDQYFRGGLVAAGTTDAPITFRASRTTDDAGNRVWWDTLFFDRYAQGTSVLRNVTVTNATNGLTASSFSALVLDNLTVEDSRHRGLVLSGSMPRMGNLDVRRSGLEPLSFGGAGLTLKLRDARFADNGGGLTLDPSVYVDFKRVRVDGATARITAGFPVLFEDVLVNGVAPSTYFVSGGTVLTSMRARDIPTVDEFRLTGSLLFRQGAVLTVDPGVTFHVDPGVRLKFGESYCCPRDEYFRGGLVAEGTATAPITLKGALSTDEYGTVSGWWDRLYFDRYAQGTSVLRNVTISNATVGVHVNGFGPLVLDNVTVEDARHQGVALSGSSPSIRNLDVRRSGLEPVTFGGGGITFKLREARFADNGLGITVEPGVYIDWRDVRVDGATARITTGFPVVFDNVLVNGVAPSTHLVSGGTVLTSMRARDIPSIREYRITGSLLFRQGAVLTVDPGVTMHMDPGVRLKFGDYYCCPRDEYFRGGLVAEGTAADPITFKGALSTDEYGTVSGWWDRILFDRYAQGTSVLRNVTISNATVGIVVSSFGPLVLDNVTVEDARNQGIAVSSASPSIRNLDVRRSGLEPVTFGGGGITFKLREARFADNGRGITVEPGVYIDWRAVDISGPTASLATGFPVILDRVTVNGVEPDVYRISGGTLLQSSTARDIPSIREYRITGSLLFRQGAVLTVDPGVTMHMDPGVRLKFGDYYCCPRDEYFRGGLVAAGTVEAPITLKGALSTDEYGTVSGWWDRLYFDRYAQGTSVLRNVTISNATVGVHVDRFGPLVLDNVTVEDARNQGIYSGSSTPQLRSVHVRRSGLEPIAFAGAGQTLYLRDVTLSDAGRGVSIEPGVRVDVHGLRIDGPHATFAGGFPIRFERVLLDGVSPRTYVVNGGTLLGSVTARDLPEIDAYHLVGSLLLRQGAVLTVEPGVTLRLDPGVRLKFGDYYCCPRDEYFRGGLVAAGTEASPIRIEAARMGVDEAGNAVGWWDRLFFDRYAAGASVLRNVTVANATVGIHAYRFGPLVLDNVTVEDARTEGVRIDASAPTLKSVHVDRAPRGLTCVNAGNVRMQSSRVTRAPEGIALVNCPGFVVTHTVFEANRDYALSAENSGTALAEYNYWGASSGPSGIGPGRGGAVLGGVDYYPWLTAPPSLLPADERVFEVKILRVSPDVVRVDAPFTVRFEVANRLDVDLDAVPASVTVTDPDGVPHPQVLDLGILPAHARREVEATFTPRAPGFHGVRVAVATIMDSEGRPLPALDPDEVAVASTEAVVRGFRVVSVASATFESPCGLPEGTRHTVDCSKLGLDASSGFTHYETAFLPGEVAAITLRSWGDASPPWDAVTATPTHAGVLRVLDVRTSGEGDVPLPAGTAIAYVEVADDISGARLPTDPHFGTDSRVVGITFTMPLPDGSSLGSSASLPLRPTALKVGFPRERIPVDPDGRFGVQPLAMLAEDGKAGGAGLFFSLWDSWRYEYETRGLFGGLLTASAVLQWTCADPSWNYFETRCRAGDVFRLGKVSGKMGQLSQKALEDSGTRVSRTFPVTVVGNCDWRSGCDRLFPPAQAYALRPEVVNPLPDQLIGVACGADATCEVAPGAWYALHLEVDAGDASRAHAAYRVHATATASGTVRVYPEADPFSQQFVTPGPGASAPTRLENSGVYERYASGGHPASLTVVFQVAAGATEPGELVIDLDASEVDSGQGLAGNRVTYRFRPVAPVPADPFEQVRATFLARLDDVEASANEAVAANVEHTTASLTDVVVSSLLLGLDLTGVTPGAPDALAAPTAEWLKSQTRGAAAQAIVTEATEASLDDLVGTLIGEAVGAVTGEIGERACELPIADALQDLARNVACTAYAFPHARALTEFERSRARADGGPDDLAGVKLAHSLGWMDYLQGVYELSSVKEGGLLLWAPAPLDGDDPFGPRDAVYPKLTPYAGRFTPNAQGLFTSADGVWSSEGGVVTRWLVRTAVTVAGAVSGGPGFLVSGAAANRAAGIADYAVGAGLDLGTVVTGYTSLLGLEETAGRFLPGSVRATGFVAPNASEAFALDVLNAGSALLLEVHFPLEAAGSAELVSPDGSVVAGAFEETLEAGLARLRATVADAAAGEWTVRVTVSGNATAYALYANQAHPDLATTYLTFRDDVGRAVDVALALENDAGLAPVAKRLAAGHYEVEMPTVGNTTVRADASGFLALEAVVPGADAREPRDYALAAELAILGTSGTFVEEDAWNHTLVVRNDGATEHALDLTVVGDPALGAGLRDRALVLAPGESAEVRIDVPSQGPVTLAGTLVLAASGTGDVLRVAPVALEGREADVDVGPGDVEVLTPRGVAATRSLVLNNTGNLASGALTVEAEGGPWLSADAAGLELAPGAGAELGLTLDAALAPAGGALEGAVWINGSHASIRVPVRLLAYDAAPGVTVDAPLSDAVSPGWRWEVAHATDLAVVVTDGNSTVGGALSALEARSGGDARALALADASVAVAGPLTLLLWEDAAPPVAVALAADGESLRLTPVLGADAVRVPEGALAPRAGTLRDGSDLLRADGAGPYLEAAADGGAVVVAARAPVPIEDAVARAALFGDVGFRATGTVTHVGAPGVVLQADGSGVLVKTDGLGLAPGDVASLRLRARWSDFHQQTVMEAESALVVGRGDPASFPAPRLEPADAAAAFAAHGNALATLVGRVVEVRTAPQHTVTLEVDGHRAAVLADWGSASTAFALGEWVGVTGPLVQREELAVLPVRYHVGVVPVAVRADEVPPTTRLAADGPVSAEGWLPAGSRVALLADDDVSGAAATYWRLAPDAEWALYDGPFALPDGRHDVEAYSVDRVGRAESPRAFAVLVDATPPTPTLAVDGEAAAAGATVVRAAPAELAFAAEDALSGAAATFWRLAPDGEWATADAFATLARGRHAVEAYAVDVAGNSGAPLAWTIIVDLDAPASAAAVAAGEPGRDGWWRSTVSVAVTAEDDLSGVALVRHRLAGDDAWSPHAEPVALAEGVHVLQASSLDVAGNEETPRNFTFLVDATPPSTEARVDGRALAAREDFGGNVTIAFAGVDATSGPAEVMYRRAGEENWTRFEGAFELHHGAHEFEAFTVDAAGNFGPVAAWTVVLDAVPPTTEARLVAGDAGEAPWLVTSAAVALDASDVGGGVAVTRYRLDGGEWATYEGPIALAAGVRVLDAASVDRAGNAEDVRSWTYHVDPDAPETTLTVLNGTTLREPWYRGPVRVALDASDAVSGVAEAWYRVDGGAWAPLGEPVTLGHGTHVIEAFALDTAGNAEATRAWTLHVDAESPTAQANGTRVERALFDPLTGVPLARAEAEAAVVVAHGSTRLTARLADSGSGLHTATLLVDGAPACELVFERAGAAGAGPAEADVACDVDASALEPGLHRARWAVEDVAGNGRDGADDAAERAPGAERYDVLLLVVSTAVSVPEPDAPDVPAPEPPAPPADPPVDPLPEVPVPDAPVPVVPLPDVPLPEAPEPTVPEPTVPEPTVPEAELPASPVDVPNAPGAPALPGVDEAWSMLHGLLP